MNPFSLQHKTILITGASSGIGAQTAITCANMGATLILTARNEARLEETLSQLPAGKHRIFIADLTDVNAIKNLVDSIDSIDGLVQSSGIASPFPIKFISEKQIKQMFEINYEGPVILTSKLFRAKKINTEASLVFMSSIASKFPYKGGALYAGSKAAINAYSKTIALEYASKRIRSNVISAAMVKTPLFVASEKNSGAALMKNHEARYPLGFGTPEDIANATAYLLSGASKWITGTEIIMDGGLTAGH